jgi:hypothetical protein
MICARGPRSIAFKAKERQVVSLPFEVRPARLFKQIYPGGFLSIPDGLPLWTVGDFLSSCS